MSIQKRERPTSEEAGLLTTKNSKGKVTRKSLPVESDVVNLVHEHFFSRVKLGAAYMIFGQENICSEDRLKEAIEDVVKVVMQKIRKIQGGRK